MTLARVALTLALDRHPGGVSALDFADHTKGEAALKALVREGLLRDTTYTLRQGRKSFRLYGLTPQGEAFLPHNSRRDG